MIQPADISSDERRKRIRFRVWRRGTRELDLILGRFADAELAAMPSPELVQFEALLDLPEPDLHGWLMGPEPPPDVYRTPLFDRIVSFNRIATP